MKKKNNILKGLDIYCIWEERIWEKDENGITTSCSQTYEASKIELNCPNCKKLILWKREKENGR